VRKKIIPYNRKGLIFTIDGIIALILGALLIIVTMYYVQSASPKFNQINLHRVALDSVTILEKDGTFYDAVTSGSTATIKQFVENLPDPYCAIIFIKDSSQATLLTATKTNCTVSDEKVIARRVFSEKNMGNIYVAEMVMWYG